MASITIETIKNNSSWKRVDESIWLEKDTCYKNVINRMIESAIKNKPFLTLGAYTWDSIPFGNKNIYSITTHLSSLMDFRWFLDIFNQHIQIVSRETLYFQFIEDNNALRLKVRMAYIISTLSMIHNANPISIPVITLRLRIPVA